MKKWSNGAKKRKAALDEREAVATDMEVLWPRLPSSRPAS